LTRLPATAQLNVYVRWLSPQVRGLELGAGVMDLLNSGYSYATAYSSNQSPMPAAGREVVFRAAYQTP
jgi:hypothetical protein